MQTGIITATQCPRLSSGALPSTLLTSGRLITCRYEARYEKEQRLLSLEKLGELFRMFYRNAKISTRTFYMYAAFPEVFYFKDSWEANISAIDVGNICLEH